MHRDIKLENVMIKDGQAILLDLNLSCRVTLGKKLTHKLGTWGFMAPEVLREDYDTRADIWSLGVCEYALLTGVMPFSNAGMPSELCLRRQSMHAAQASSSTKGITTACF